MKRILVVLLTIFIFIGCTERNDELKLNITSVDNKIIRLTKNNVLEIKNHSTQNYFDKYTIKDIEKIGYAKQAIPYTNRNILTNHQEELLANVLVIKLINNSQFTFYLKESDDIEEVLKNANFEISSLNIRKLEQGENR
ncbi:hypothetical protein ACOL3H_07160 [Aliarcobacter butzleri]